MKPDQLDSELTFKASGSSGPGGQHANRVYTRVTLYFDVSNSQGLNANEKKVILRKTGKRINKEGMLMLSCDTHRSQHRNKEAVIAQFHHLLRQALKRKKKRRATKPPPSARRNRLKNKKMLAEKKEQRKKIRP